MPRSPMRRFQLADTGIYESLAFLGEFVFGVFRKGRRARASDRDLFGEFRR